MDYRIEKLCKDWRSASIQPDGKLLFTPKTESLRLSNNGIEPHLLSFDELVTFGSEAGKNLLAGNLNSFIATDHYLFWSWTATLLLDPFPGPKRTEIYEDAAIHTLFATCLSCNLGKISLNDIRIAGPVPASLISSFMGFPLLEALCRKLMSEYLTSDGMTIKTFTVRRAPNNEKTYEVNRRCNSLGDALLFASTNIKNKKIKQKLKELMQNLEQFSQEGENGHTFLYTLRNSALHAGQSSATIGGTLLTIGLLMALTYVEDQYWERRQWARDSISFTRNGDGAVPGWFGTYAAICKAEIPKA